MKQLLPSLFFLLFIHNPLQAQQPEIFQTKDGIALKGYDPVAFFTEQKAVKGTDTIRLVWKAATWLFSSLSNREQFRSNPEKFAPQYGGYCAYGVAGNHKSPTETDTWTVVDGRLYFNYNQAVRKLWLQDTVQLIRKANLNWEKIKAQ